MNKKYIKENKTLVESFIGALIKASCSEKANKLVKRLSQRPENKKRFISKLDI